MNTKRSSSASVAATATGGPAAVTSSVAATAPHQQPYHRFKNGANSALMETAIDPTSSSTNVVEAQRPKPMIGNINSPSVSMASVSSDETSNESGREKRERMSSQKDVPAGNSSNTSRQASKHLDGEEARFLHLELARLTEALGRLRRAFQDTSDRREVTRKVTTERLGEMLKVLRPLLDRYPVLQTGDVMNAASHLIDQVTHYTNNQVDYHTTIVDFYEALDCLKGAMSDSVSECVVVDSSPETGGGIGNYKMTPVQPQQIVFPTYGDQPHPEHDQDFGANIYHTGDLDFNKDLIAASRKDTLMVSSVDQVDAVLMRHDRGVDLALDRAKLWSKYAKDVLIYVEKRMAIELDWVKNLAKLAQERRPVLKEESHLPFQSVYCIALDVVSST